MIFKSKLIENVLKSFGYLRGYLFSATYLDERSLICKFGKIRFFKENAEVKIGRKTTLWPNVRLSCAGTRERIATLDIGSRCSVGDRTEIHCGESITIGDETIISWDCAILDRDFHSLDAGNEKTAPIKIGRGVWIGCKAIILKGVTIGDNAVVAAGSVVTKSIPANVLVAGNPAVVKKTINGWRLQK
jgi:acetyltransferase-like isoleucine patch superfamily enzyme